MDTPFNITVTLDKKELRNLIAQYVATKLGNGFSVQADGIEFNVETSYGDRPGEVDTYKFTKVTAKATKADNNKMPDVWDQPG